MMRRGSTSKAMADSLNITIDSERFFTALDYYISVMPTELRDKAMRRQFRILIQRIMAWTPPHKGRGGNTDAALKQGEAAIIRDLRRVAIVLDDDAAFDAFALGRADGTYIDVELKKGKFTSVQLDRSGDTLMDQHGRLRNRRGGINRGQRPIVLTTRSGLDRAAKRPLARVGVAKSGWHPALAQLGGMSPAWIARHGGGQGSIVDIISSEIVEIRASNWARSVASLAPRLVSTSVKAQSAAMIRELEKAAESTKFRAKLGKEIAAS